MCAIMFLALFLIACVCNCVCMFVLLLCALLSVYVSVRLGLSPSCPLLSVSMSSFMHMNVCMHCEYCPHLSSFWSFVSRCLVCLCLCVPVGCGLCGGAGGRVILILLFELYIVQKHLFIPRDHPSPTSSNHYWFCVSSFCLSVSISSLCLICIWWFS